MKMYIQEEVVGCRGGGGGGGGREEKKIIRKVATRWELKTWRVQVGGMADGGRELRSNRLHPARSCGPPGCFLLFNLDSLRAQAGLMGSSLMLDAECKMDRFHLASFCREAR
eukprot:3934781-Rhodomonas_salina.3